MKPETIVYIIKDRQGRSIVLPTRAEAEAFEIADAPGIEARPFGWVLAHEPKALVRIWYQYYYAEELAEPA